MSNAGWVKAHRAMLDHPLLQRADALAVWMRLLLMAAHEPVRVKLRGMPIPLDAGQCACSMAELGRRSGITRQRMRTIADSWVADGMLKINPAQGQAFSIVTICNYEKYQGSAVDREPRRQPRNNPAATQQQPTEQEPKNPESTGALPSPTTTTESGPQPRASAKAHLWDEMKARVGGKRPGAVVARWCADYGDGEVFASHFEAEAKNPADYVSFMVATLKRRAADKPRSAKGERRSLLEQSANILNGVNGHAGPGHPGAGEAAPLHPAISPPDVRRV